MTFRRPACQRTPAVLKPIPQDMRRGVMTPVEGGDPVPKTKAFRSEAWRRAVASLPCVCCGREGQTQAAHPNHIGKGMGIKASDSWAVPLCMTCHAEFDQGARWTKVEKHDLMERWIIETINELAVRGLVKA